jgi:hypothetical protein
MLGTVPCFQSWLKIEADLPEDRLNARKAIGPIGGDKQCHWRYNNMQIKTFRLLRGLEVDQEGVQENRRSSS